MFKQFRVQSQYNIHARGEGSGSGTFGSYVQIGKGNGPRIQSTQESADNDVQGLAFFTKLFRAFSG